MRRSVLPVVFAALFVLMLCGCTAQKQEETVASAPEPVVGSTEITEAPVQPEEPEPEPEPEPLPVGEEVLLFGERVPTLKSETALYVDAETFAERAGLLLSIEEDTLRLSADGESKIFQMARSDELEEENAFLQDGAAYVPLARAAEAFGFVSGTAEDGMTYFAKQLTLTKPAENVNVPVLMYHAVSDDKWGYWDLFVSPQTIEEELQYLQENGYETIWFEDLSHVEDYEKPVILTFDDGYDDNYTELFPLLQKYSAKATIFVIPKAIGTAHKMTAEQVYELSQSGLVSIQSHTYSHGNLSTMDEETLIFEMEASRNYLAALTGQVPYAVCYPEGTRSELSIEVAGRYYDYGLLMNGQLYNTSDDPLRVKRYYIPRGYDLGSFRWSVQDAGTSRNW